MEAHQAPPSLGFSRQEAGVGCHFLLQCMKVKSESEVAQSCLTLSDPMDCSPPGSSVHGIFQARVLEWVASAFSENSHLEQLKIAVTFIYSVIIQTNSEFSYGTQLLLIAWLNCFAEGGL